MNDIDPASIVESEAELDELYGAPSPASKIKEATRIVPEYRALIEASPFAVLATSGPGGLDCSPRGDAPGFVRVKDDRTLLLPDRRGNNRIDSLRNIVHDPRVALLFLVPGLGETLRVNGRARLTRDAALCDSLAHQGRAPKLVIEIAVETVFFQCARAIMRSSLWDPTRHVARGDLPTAGQMLKATSAGEAGGDDYDRDLDRRMKAGLY
ncbi:pyridoxamine 5'-phosphate oxidase family protein [Kaustia mangrovi]|uniref:Pyridoxamine 5'-phosphate oxidase family protein n=1 Tax=Kaustia mangrovi TaxID=2593653 RepID=A0A7S8C7I1_9HYPH|nr:pyridoxamine 5'-phosphate oxidase family protein [Kaustia mangrovi]QPC44792.1 pyridoxamine 5'-phosphate oxidase family protein [Kaustia mangrovi]